MVQGTGEQQQGRQRALPLLILADLESLRAPAAGATISPSLDSTGRERFATNLSFQGQSIREIQVDSDVRTSDVIACARGAAGPAQEVQHQPEGTMPYECHFQRRYLVLTIDITMECTLVAQRDSVQVAMHDIIGSNINFMHIQFFVFPCMYH